MPQTVNMIKEFETPTSKTNEICIQPVSRPDCLRYTTTQDVVVLILTTTTTGFLTALVRYPKQTKNKKQKRELSAFAGNGTLATVIPGYWARTGIRRPKPLMNHRGLLFENLKCNYRKRGISSQLPSHTKRVLYSVPNVRENFWKRWR